MPLLGITYKTFTSGGVISVGGPEGPEVPFLSVPFLSVPLIPLFSLSPFSPLSGFSFPATVPFAVLSGSGLLSFFLSPPLSEAMAAAAPISNTAASPPSTAAFRRFHQLAFFGFFFFLGLGSSSSV